MLILVSGSTLSVGRAGKNVGILLTPGNRNSMESVLATGRPWAADNGAFKGFDSNKFLSFLSKISHAPRCIFVACPDEVACADETIRMYGHWQSVVAASGQPVAFVLQDGQENLPLPDADAYFIGGSTQFKLSQAALTLADEAKRRGKWLHMGRVNSRRRLAIAQEMGCDSVDGTACSMFGDVHIPKFSRWSRQLSEQLIL